MLKLVLVCGLASTVAFAHSGMHAHPHKEMQGKKHEVKEKFFKEADVNNDGSLSKEEFNTFHVKMEEYHNQNKSSVEEKFKKVDANKDGMVSKDEMKNCKKGGKSKHGSAK